MLNVTRFHKIYKILIPNETHRSGLDLANSREHEFVNLLNIAFIMEYNHSNKSIWLLHLSPLRIFQEPNSPHSSNLTQDQFSQHRVAHSIL
jgi:hypothetical protein